MPIFTVGQKVMYEVDRTRPGIYRVSDIKAINSRQLILDDGSRWTTTGAPWGQSGGWNTTFLREYDEALHLESRRKFLAITLSKVKWSDFTLEQLRELHTRVNEMVSKEGS